AVRFGFGPKKIFRLAKYAFKELYSDEIIKKWLTVFYKRFFANQFKRSCIPDGPKVGSVSLSPRADFRMPSDASVKVWQKQLEML
ncbi:MAG TPA: NAD(+) synthase, partial [Clostridia bacterium]